MIVFGIVFSLIFSSDKNDDFLNLDFSEQNREQVKEKPKASYKKELDKYREQYKNNDIVAKVEIEGTNIKSLVTQTVDNDFYLTHSITKENDPVGTIFMDYRTKVPARKILLYGHNSKNLNTIFHGLEGYIEESFYKEHKNIKLYTDIDTYVYEIFSVMVIDNDFQYFLVDFTDEQWLPHLNNLKSRSLYDTKVKLKKSDEVLILQTCYYHPDGSYLIISARKI